MKIPPKYLFVAIWAALLFLLLGMFGLAQLDLKIVGMVLILALAPVQMFLVLLFFMRLRNSINLVRLVAAVGFVWLLILFTLAFSDYLTRQWH
jgi:cytochrome c oxidase subunit IV